MGAVFFKTGRIHSVGHKLSMVVLMMVVVAPMVMTCFANCPEVHLSFMRFTTDPHVSTQSHTGQHSKTLEAKEIEVWNLSDKLVVGFCIS